MVPAASVGTQLYSVPQLTDKLPGTNCRHAENRVVPYTGGPATNQLSRPRPKATNYFG